MGGNRALIVNPNLVNGQSAAIHITDHGSDWYWAVCALMTLATLVFFGLSFTVPRTWRLFHYITASITLVAAIAYFTMASNLGWTPIDVEYRRTRSVVRGVNREIFYVRYIDWFITTPLLLTDILLTAGLPWPTILVTLLLDEVMIVTGLVGALVRSSYKWGFFTFGCVAMLAVLYNVLWVGRMHARPLGADINRTYLSVAGLTVFLWCLYPIAWGLCEGGNVISPDSEAIFYGILDILAKIVFGILLLLGHRNVDPARMGIHIRDYDDVPGLGRTHEKQHNGLAADTVAVPVVPVVPVTATTTSMAV
ncbi:MAG: ion channel activity [Phylliscum demangeonii]|nr:MAG: ion channel activity [Phylliscum demangeonii]